MIFPYPIDTLTPARIEFAEERKVSETAPSFNFHRSQKEGDEERQGTIFGLEKKDIENNGFKADAGNLLAENSINDRRAISPGYMGFNVGKFAEGIVEDLDYWTANGTENSLFKIADVKDKIDYFSPYLTKSDEGSIFINIVDLIFENNNWDKMSVGQIQVFSDELKKFKEGGVDWQKLELFAKQINRLKMDILHSNEIEGQTS